MPNSTTEGWVFNIQRFSLHDGPGIRTTVFMKGCPLRCQWCHNPEGLTSQPQIRLATNLCTKCGRCMAVCPQGGHDVTPDGHELHLENCERCGRCADVCPAAAVELVGRRMSVDDVLAVVRRDVPFYEQSNGGMTLSGGEPMAQYEFTRDLLEAARAEEIATAVETSALAPWDRLASLADLVDLWMVDLKHTDSGRHRDLTGVPNEQILANIRAMVAAGWKMTVRVPWVPERNAEDVLLSGLIEFLTDLPHTPALEFMLYHRLGVGKWASLGGESTMPMEIPAARREDVEPWLDRLAAAGVEATVS